MLILNDHDTGYPFACLESSIISATRTAASAALAADWLSRGRPRPTRVGFIGVGLIARYIHTFLAGTGWSFDEIGVHDLSADSAAGFRGYLEQSGTASRITVHDSAEQLIRSSDLVVFATVAGQPHISDLSWFDHHPLVLHVSLRDLAPEILLASTNIVDDVEHCLKADTSPHLAEQLTGNRDFLLGTLDDVMAGRVTVPADRTVVFSPFGLGVLDLAVGKYVYDEVARAGELHVVDDFFHETAPVRLSADALDVAPRGRADASAVVAPPAAGQEPGVGAPRRAATSYPARRRASWTASSFPHRSGCALRSVAAKSSSSIAPTFTSASLRVHQCRNATRGVPRRPRLRLSRRRERRAPRPR